MKNPRDIIVEPVVSEKSYDLVGQNNTCSFIVDPRSNKTEIKQAIESIFEVRVVGVSTLNRQPMSTPPHRHSDRHQLRLLTGARQSTSRHRQLIDQVRRWPRHSSTGRIRSRQHRPRQEPPTRSLRQLRTTRLRCRWNFRRQSDPAPHRSPSSPLILRR